MGYTAQAGQDAGASSQKAIPGVFWNILSSIIHKNNLFPPKLSEGRIGFSPIFPTIFGGASTLLVISCSQASSQAPPPLHFLPLWSYSLPLLRNTVPYLHVLSITSLGLLQGADFAEGEEDHQNSTQLEAFKVG